MRLALLSDVHGNPIALDAVVADVARAGGVDAYWILGDLAAIGHDPVAVLERLVSLPGVRFVRGNTDRYVVTGGRPPPTVDEAAADRGLLQRLVRVAESFAWTQGYVTAAGWLDFLASLPLELEETLPDGTRLLGVHASPGRDDGRGLAAAMDADELERRLAGAEADLVVAGHTHGAFDRRVGDVRIVNLGSVSNPIAGDLRASYALLHAHGGGYDLDLRRVEYDHAAVIEAVHAVRHPAAELIAAHQRGEIAVPAPATSTGVAPAE